MQFGPALKQAWQATTTKIVPRPRFLPVFLAELRSTMGFDPSEPCVHQFFHISGYGHRARPGEGRHATASGMLGEAFRQSGAVAHLSEPRPAQILYGKDFGELIAILADLKDRARDSAGRRLRCDAALMLFGVFSYPLLRSDLVGVAAIAAYQAWRLATIAWIWDKMGFQVASIVEHDDELYPHIHVVLLPSVSASGQLDWTRVHPGRAAKALSAARGDSATTQNALYRQAMSSLQDDYFEAVGASFDHARVGPRRARRERHHHLQTREAEAASNMLKAENASLQAKIEALQQEAANLAAQLQARSHADTEPQSVYEVAGPVEHDHHMVFGNSVALTRTAGATGSELALELHIKLDDPTDERDDIGSDVIDHLDNEYLDVDFDDVDRATECLWDEADILDWSDHEAVPDFGEQEEPDY